METALELIHEQSMEEVGGTGRKSLDSDEGLEYKTRESLELLREIGSVIVTRMLIETWTIKAILMMFQIELGDKVLET